MSLSGSSFLRGVLALASGTVMAQFVAILASPLLSRIYSPKDFGVLGVFSALLGVASVASSFRYEFAIPIARTNAAASNLFVLSVAISATVALSMGFLITALHSEIRAANSIHGLARYIWLLPVGVLLLGVYRSLHYLVVRERALGVVARTRVAQAVGGVLTQVGSGFAHLGAIGLIVGQVISQSAGIGSYVRHLWPKLRKLRGAVTKARVKAMAKKYERFPKFDLLAATVDTLANNLPQFMISLLFGASAGGAYLLAFRVINVPASVIGYSVGQAMYSDVRNLGRNGTLERTVYRIAISLAVLICVPATVLFIFGEPLFALVFGEQWHAAGIYASWLVLGAAIQFIYAPMSLVLLATNSQHVNLLIQCILLSTKCASIMLGYVEKDPIVAIVALALSDVVAYSIGLALIMYQVRRKKSAIWALGR